MAILFRDFDKRVEIRSAREGLIRFRRHADAVLYLRKHRGRPGLVAALRQLLAEHRHLQVWRLSDEEVFEETARRLLDGSLQLLEMLEPRTGGPTTPQEEPQEAESVEEELDSGPAAAAPAAVPLPAQPPLLPLLEEVQIEGAEVLPEIMQTLDQIDLTIAGIDLAGVSLAPAPSGVPAISSAMQQASDSANASLGAM